MYLRLRDSLPLFLTKRGWPARLCFVRSRMFNFDSTLLLIFLMIRVCLSGIERKILSCVFVNFCTSTFAMAYFIVCTLLKVKIIHIR